MLQKHCFVYLCYDFPIICILCFTKSCFVYLCYDFLLFVFYVSQELFCISVLWIPYYWYFMSHKSCFVYLCSAFPIIGILCFTKSCFVYLCYDFPIICILCLTRVVLYICVLLSLLLVFDVSQALFCISVLWFPYNWYFMFHKHCFVHLCYDFPIIDILCFTRLFCISVLWFPYNWYFMSHKRCFVYLCYDFPIIGILFFTSVVLYICVMSSP